MSVTPRRTVLIAGAAAFAIGAGIAACDTPGPTSDPVVLTTVPAVAPAPKAIETGTYVVGTDIQPGTYRAESTEALCLWVRKSEVGGSPTNGRIDSGIGKGAHIIEVLPTDKALYVSKCGVWQRIGEIA